MQPQMNRNNKTRTNKEDFSNFDALKLTLASPEQILGWSYGEVTKAETIIEILNEYFNITKGGKKDGKQVSYKN